MISVMLFSLGMTFTVVLALGVFLLTTLGHQGFHFFARFFSRELAGLDGRGELFLYLGELIVAPFVMTLAVILGMVFALGVFLLAVLSLHLSELFAGIFP